MGPLTEKRKQEIRTAIRADRKPARGGSNRTILAMGAGKNRRQNKYVVLADGAGKLTPAVASSLTELDEWFVNTLAAESCRLLGSQLSVEEVRKRFQPTLRTHEASGQQSLRLKMNTTGRSAVRIWNPMGTQISAPESWSQCSAKCRIRLKGCWRMAKEIGVIAECIDVQLDMAEAECPF